MSKLHLLQICNVGQIVGGTAACAWTLVQALPDWCHTIAFRGNVTAPTRLAFSPHQVVSDAFRTGRLRDVRADVVLLHNIADSSFAIPQNALSIQYVHSAGQRIVADRTVFCSAWLSRELGMPSTSVLWQGVPIPQRSVQSDRSANSSLHIGRICTPIIRKWPESLANLYTFLSLQHPDVDWEFVGCPASLQSSLYSACRGKATFHPANWEARSRLWTWNAMLYHHPDLTESFGRIVAEAARTGCIPIVDERGGFSEQLHALDLMGCQTPKEFSEAIDRLKKLQSQEAESTRIAQLAHHHFSIHAFRDRFLQIVSDCAGKP